MHVLGVRGTWTAMFLAFSAASVAQAQGPVLLRYQPTQGTSVRTILGARGTIVLREVQGGVPTTDSVVGEMSRLAGVTQRVLQVDDRLRLVELQYDSLRIRSRLLGQSWKETALSDGERGPFRIQVDDRWQWGGPATASLAGLKEWLVVEMPEEPIAPGGTWSYPTSFRPPPELGALLEISVTDSLEGTATITLDSVVVRAANDSLIYLRVDKTLGPMTLPAVDAGDSALVEVRGTQAGTLIWSTAWQSFASGATQTRVNGRLRGMGAAATQEASVTWLITTRLQVRF